MKKYRILATVTFCIYIFFLIWIIIFKLDFGIEDHLIERTRRFNLIPFGNTGGTPEIIDNILLFVPFGLFLRMKNKGRFPINALIMLVSSVALELLQYATALGVCDVTDVITNTAGGLSGYGLTSLLFVIFKKDEDKTTRWLSIVSSLVLFCVFGFLGFFAVCMLIGHI